MPAEEQVSTKKEKKKRSLGVLKLQEQLGPVRSADLQQFILAVLASSSPFPRWGSVRPASMAQRVVLVIAHGVQSKWLAESPSDFKPWIDLLGRPLTFRARHANMLPIQTAHDILYVREQKKRHHEKIFSNQPAAKRLRLKSDNDISGAGAPALLEERDEATLPPPSHYILTPEQQKELDYPLPLLDNKTGMMSSPPGFLPTKSGLTTRHKIVAIDCEMCATVEGLELTRATLLDEEGNVLIDELVLPFNAILDYNTQYSGITASMLQNVDTRLGDVRDRILATISSETIVIAHGGENDLRALKILHGNVVDTAILYPHRKGPGFRPALRILAQQYLHRSIQKCCGREGHNSVEDAKAALDLAMLKFRKGPSFGVARTVRGDPLTEVLSGHGKRSTLVDRLHSLNKFVMGNCNAVVADSDERVAELMAREVAKPGASFICTQLLDLAMFYEKRATSLGGKERPWEYYCQNECQRVVNTVYGHVSKIVDVCPSGTLLIVLSGEGDTHYHKLLEDIKSGSDVWSPSLEEIQCQAKFGALDALCFIKFIQRESDQ